MKASIIRFPGNSRVVFRREFSATVITLPVIRIERFEDEPPPWRQRKSKAAMRLLVNLDH